jgi:WD40 repeat protein
VKVWDHESGDLLAKLSGHTGDVYTVNFSPDGSRIVSGSNDCTIILWDAKEYDQVFVLRGHSSYVHSVCFSPDGTMLASGSGDGTVRVWDSLSPAERLRRIQKQESLLREAEPLVNQMMEKLGDPLAVADELRGDKTMDDDLRGAALLVLLKRSQSRLR